MNHIRVINKARAMYEDRNNKGWNSAWESILINGINSNEKATKDSLPATALIISNDDKAHFQDVSIPPNHFEHLLLH